MVVALITPTGYFMWTSLIHSNYSDKISKSEKKPEISFVDKQLQSMTLRQKVSNLLILHTSGTNLDSIKEYLQKYQPAGLIFMKDNIPSTLDELSEMTKQLQTNPELPYLFAIDEEGGVVSRLDDDTFPAANELKSQPPSATESAFRQRSNILNQAGMNLNFGIVADTTSNSSSFIYKRVFGGDPTLVSKHVRAAVRGEKGFVLSTLKHFPGHGEAEADSHFSIPTTNITMEQWQKNDNPPFLGGIKEGAQFVMFGHLAYIQIDTLPASLSTKWHETLKDEDNFKGVSITDDMIMLQQSGDQNYLDPVKNAISALNAGNTILLYVLDHGGGATNIDPDIIIDGIVKAVNNGEIDIKIINENTRQVLNQRHDISDTIKKS